MNDYSQPDFYRFNEDSLLLIKHVQSKIQNPQSILDLGAGSGILGIELALNSRPMSLTLVELQEEFKNHLELNVAFFLNNAVATDISIASFSDFKSPKKFDLIVCNPPYYLPGHGQPSPNRSRHLARTFVKDSWNELFLCIHRNLAANGTAFLVIKNQPEIVEEMRKVLLKDLNAEFFELKDLLIVTLTRLNID